MPWVWSVWSETLPYARERKGGKNNRAQSITPTIPKGLPTQHDASSIKCGGQCYNKLYGTRKILLIWSFECHESFI